MRAIGLVLAKGGLRAYFGLCRDGMLTNRIVAGLQKPRELRFRALLAEGVAEGGADQLELIKV